MSATATVEVLTAEVRVLMVGSRQVTLSVYGQLDEVSPWKIKPFGRVHAKNAERNRTEVVGADAAGNLCRSWLQNDDGWRFGYAGCGQLLDPHLNQDRFQQVKQLMGDWKQLPLIVLAGLR